MGTVLDAEDVEEVAGALERGNSVAVLAVENLRAIPFIDAVEGVLSEDEFAAAKAKLPGM